MKKKSDQQIRVWKGPKDKVWEELRIEKLGKKKNRGREGHQGRMCKMNIKVEEFSTATDNSWCPHTKINKTDFSITAELRIPICQI